MAWGVRGADPLPRAVKHLCIILYFPKLKRLTGYCGPEALLMV